jgi:hypothetical protein
VKQSCDILEMPLYRVNSAFTPNKALTDDEKQKLVNDQLNKVRRIFLQLLNKKKTEDEIESDIDFLNAKEELTRLRERFGLVETYNQSNNNRRSRKNRKNRTNRNRNTRKH